MAQKKMAHATRTNANGKGDAKVQNIKDITKVLGYFRYNMGTTLDCMLATGVRRNSITWYVHDLQKMGALRWVYRQPDQHTGRLAKYYSADPSQWRSNNYRQGKEEFCLWV